MSDSMLQRIERYLALKKLQHAYELLYEPIDFFLFKQLYEYSSALLEYITYLNNMNLNESFTNQQLFKHIHNQHQKYIQCL